MNEDDSIKKLSDQIVKTYPALKKAKKDFIFGYKVGAVMPAMRSGVKPSSPPPPHALSV